MIYGIAETASRASRSHSEGELACKSYKAALPLGRQNFQEPCRGRLHLIKKSDPSPPGITLRPRRGCCPHRPIGDHHRLFPVVRGSWTFHINCSAEAAN